MKNKTLMVCILALALSGCNESSNRRTFAPEPTPPKTPPEVNVVNPVPFQTSYLINVGGFEVVNKSDTDMTLTNIRGTFTSTNLLLDLVNVDIYGNGNRVKVHQPQLQPKTVDPYKMVDLPMDFTIAPGETGRIDIMAQPGSFTTAGLLRKDFFGFDVDVIESTHGDIRITLPEVKINEGGINHSSIFSNAFVVPVFQSAQQDILLYQETLENFSLSDQVLYDYHVRFRAGRRNSRLVNTELRGFLTTYINGQFVDSVPVSGDVISLEYKLGMAGRLLRRQQGALVEIFLSGHNAQPGNVVTLDRIAYGSELGVVDLPTILGIEIQCN